MSTTDLRLIYELRHSLKTLPFEEVQEIAVMALYHAFVMTETRNSFTPEFLKEACRRHAPKRLPIVEDMHRESVKFIRNYIKEDGTMTVQPRIAVENRSAPLALVR